MIRIAVLAALYWAAIFVLGFALGSFRVLWLTPRLGAMGAVLAELPVMLAAAWIWARHLLHRLPLPMRCAALAMGTLAFALLMAAELALGKAAFGFTASDWLAALITPQGLAGLAGQAVFGVVPALVWRGIHSASARA